MKKFLRNRELSSSLLALLFEFNTSVQSKQALVLKQLLTGFTGKFYWKKIKISVFLEKQSNISKLWHSSRRDNRAPFFCLLVFFFSSISQRMTYIVDNSTPQYLQLMAIFIAWCCVLSVESNNTVSYKIQMFNNCTKLLYPAVQMGSWEGRDDSAEEKDNWIKDKWISYSGRHL